MRKYFIKLLILLAFVLVGGTQAQFFEARGKAQDSSALSSLEAVKTAMEMYAADNGTYPQGITTVTTLVSVLGADWPTNVRTDASKVGSLIAVATNKNGTEYRLYAVGRDGYHCYGLAQNGTKVGPGTLSDLVKSQGKPLPKDVSKTEEIIVGARIEKKEIENKAGTTLKSIRKAMQTYSAVNGAFPKGINSVDGLVKALGKIFHSDISIKGTSPGTLAAAATSNKGVVYRIYVIGKDENSYYGMAQDGTISGPDVLKKVIKKLGKPFPKEILPEDKKTGRAKQYKPVPIKKISKQEDGLARSTLSAIKTAMEMYAADNGNYPQGIVTAEDLKSALGSDYPTNIKTGKAVPGALISVATKGNKYRIYAVGGGKSRCFGLAQNGAKAGPDTLSNVVKTLGEPFPIDISEIENTLDGLKSIEPVNIKIKITKGEEVYAKDMSFYKKGETGAFKIILSAKEIKGHAPDSLAVIYEGNNLFAVYGLDSRADQRKKMFRSGRVNRRQFESFPEYIEKNEELKKIWNEISQANSNLRKGRKEKNTLKKQIEEIKKGKPQLEENLSQLEERLENLDKMMLDNNSTVIAKSKIRTKLNKELEEIMKDLMKSVLEEEPAYVIYGRFKSAGEAVLNVNSRISGELLLKINFKLPDNESENIKILNEWRAAQKNYMVKLNSVTPGDSIFPYINTQSNLRIDPKKAKKQNVNTNNRSRRRPQRDRRNLNLYSITTGALAIQESLQLDRMTASTGKVSPQEVSIEKLTGPNIKSHPFSEMMEGREPKFMDMASLVPEDFYYFHFSDINKEIEFSDLLDQWGTSLLNVMQVSSQDAQIKEKYLTQLCIELSLLTRLFGDEVIEDLAIAGSDPFLHEGTDISVIFNVKNKLLFNASMSKYLADAKEKFSDLEESDIDYGDYSIHAAVTPDRTVSSYSCYLDDFKVYSNSQKALEKIIDTYNEKQASLANAADFLYMRTIFLGGKPDEDAFLYLSESNIRKLVGPEWKIARRRRMECVNSLRIINNAISLYYMENNIEPPTVENLIAGHYLEEDYLVCPDGGSYKLFAERQEPNCSKHGRLRYFTPIIELPVTMISREEEKEYGDFVRRYNSFWSRFFDPVGIRIKFDNENIKVETCILPLIENSIYNGFKLLSGGDPVNINTPAAEGTIFQFFTKLNLDLENFSDARLINQFVGKTSFTKKQFIDMLGDNISINSMDGDMMFSFDLTRGGGMLGSLARNRGQVIAGSFLISSLSLPTYLTFSVKDEVLASQFVNEFLRSLADENARSRMKQRRSWISVYTYQVSPAYKDHKIETLDMELFVVRLRLHFMVYKNHLIIANQRDVLTKIIDNPLEFTDKEANIMLNIRSEAFDRVAKIVKLGWQERMRKVCVNNLGSIYALHRFRSIPFDQINNTSLTVNGHYPYCPSNGEYIYEKKRDTVYCTVHGDILSPKQPFDIDPEVSLNKFISGLKNIETSLSFTPEGIMTSLTIKREGKE